MSAPPACDATRCPLCGRPNECAMASGAETHACWCSPVRIAPQVLVRIPPASQRVACLCPSCAGAGPAAHEQRP